MRENNVGAKTMFNDTNNSKHDYPSAGSILNGDFNPVTPNQAWIADKAYIFIDEGWLYLAAIVDLFNRKIVGWAMYNTMTKELIINALKQAIGRYNPPTGIIHHSDRGTKYASYEYQELLSKYDFIGSMSRKGNYYDNAFMGSYFGTLKTELIYLTRFKTRAEARLSIFDYIEVFYNRTRLRSKLGYKSPVDFESSFVVA